MSCWQEISHLSRVVASTLTVCQLKKAIKRQKRLPNPFINIQQLNIALKMLYTNISILLVNSPHPSKPQKQSALIRQLEEELRMAHLRNPDQEIQNHMEALYAEKEHLTKEVYLLRETIKVS